MFKIIKRPICFIYEHQWEWIWGQNPEQHLIPYEVRCSRCNKLLSRRFKPNLRKGGRKK